MEENIQAPQAFPTPADTNKKEATNRKTSMFSILSIILILLWFMVLLFIILFISRVDTVHPFILNVFANLYYVWFLIDGFSFILIKLLIVLPPLALIAGLISLFQPNNTKKGKLISITGIILGTLLSIPALGFWILDGWN